VCSFKTLHGLEPPIRYDAKHHNSTSVANVPEASKEEFAIDGKHKMKAIAFKNDFS
jgi:hypothetical protein